MKGKPRKGFEEGMYEIDQNPGIKTREQLVEEGLLPPEEEMAKMEQGQGENKEQQEQTQTQEGQGDEIEETKTEAPQLVIDEGKKTPAGGRQRKKSGTATPAAATPASTPASSARPSRKRKAEEMMSPAVATTPTTETPTSTGEPERTSRSGRVIKSKKFADEVKEGNQAKVITVNSLTLLALSLQHFLLCTYRTRPRRKEPRATTERCGSR